MVQGFCLQTCICPLKKTLQNQNELRALQAKLLEGGTKTIGFSMAPGTTFKATQGKLCLIFAVPLLIVKRLELIPGHCEGSRKSESQFRVFPHVFVRQAFQPVSLHTNVGKCCKIR